MPRSVIQRCRPVSADLYYLSRLNKRSREGDQHSNGTLMTGDKSERNLNTWPQGAAIYSIWIWTTYRGRDTAEEGEGEAVILEKIQLQGGLQQQLVQGRSWNTQKARIFFSSFCLFLSSFKEIVCINFWWTRHASFTSSDCSPVLSTFGRYVEQQNKRKNSFTAFSKASNCFERTQEQAFIRSVE